jgi:hypothetical protein
MAKEAFEKIRQTKLTDEEFFILLILIPAFSVAHADGTYKKEEKEVMQLITLNLISQIYDELSKDELNSMAEEYESDFKFILTHKELETNLLHTLKDKCIEIPELKNQVLSFMKELANASDGLSKLEIAKIDEINLLLS